MELDNNIKNSLLSLDDQALKNVVNSLAKSAGVNTSKIKISDSDILKIRNAIMDATNEDASEALKLIGEQNARRILDDANKRGDK